MIIVNAAFALSHGSSTIKQGTTATLLVAIMNTGVRSIETWRGSQWQVFGKKRKDLPMCSAFSQLLFNFAMLSAAGNGSS